MINEKEKLSLNMTNRHEDTTDTDTRDNNNVNKINNNKEKETNGNSLKKKASPTRSLDLPKYGAIRKQLSPEKFILDSPIADLPTPVNEDAETTEFWSKLRCGSLRTEEVAEREKQKQERMKNRQSRQSQGYPGLAFGSAMFGSDTTMKFNIIKNELHNIMRSQLKRVDGEMNAFSSRVKEFDKHLEESEAYIRQATAALAEVVALQAEEDKTQNEDNENESNLSAFDQHVLFLETQLLNAKMKASQSFQILEDCDQAQESLLINSTPISSPSWTPSSDPSEPAAETLSKSSIYTNTNRPPAPLKNDANGNSEDPHTNLNPQSQITTKEMEENIANGNVTEDVTNGNGGTAFDTLNLQQRENLQQEENIQNGNVQNNAAILNSTRQVENSRNKLGNDSKKVFNSNNRNGNANCFQAILSEDSANANLPL